jgi:TPR repeat protein
MNLPRIAASARATRVFTAAPRRRIAAKGVAAVLAALLLLVASGCANADALQDAATAYKKRDFPTALRLWRPLAEQGNAAAQKGLGTLYEYGSAVPKDEAEAAVWYGKAAAQGDADGEFRLGLLYLRGAGGLPQDVPRALDLLKQAAAQGNTLSAYQLATIYWDGAVGVAKDGDQAIAWYRKAAALDEPLAESQLALAYQYGRNVPKDPTLAYFWWRRAEEHWRRRAEQGDAVAQLALAQLYERGEGTITDDKSTALYWYQQLVQPDGRYKALAERAIARLKSAAEAGGR